MKRCIFNIVLIFTIMIIPFSAYADEYHSEGFFQYTIRDDTVQIHLYFGEEKTVVIPTTIAEKPVVSIDEYAFAGNIKVESITIPEYVTKVGDKTFYGATSLKKIVNKSEKLTLKLKSDITIENDYPKYVTTEVPQKTKVPNKTKAPEKTIKPTEGSNNLEIASNSASFDRKGLLSKDEKKLITVDDSKNLVEIDINGQVNVLDRDKEYTLSEDKDGKVSIEDENGDKVSINEDGEIEEDNKEESNKEDKNVSIVWYIVIGVIITGLLCFVVVVTIKVLKAHKVV